MSFFANPGGQSPRLPMVEPLVEEDEEPSGVAVDVLPAPPFR